MKLRYAIIAFLVIFFVACSDSNDEKQEIQAEIKNNYDAPFTLLLNDGNSIYMQRNANGFDAEKNDKTTIFIFFTSWCKPCEVQMQYLSKFQKIYGDGLKIVGILMEDKSKEEADEFANNANLNFQIAYGQSNYFFAKAIGDVEAFPYMLMLGKNGETIRNYVGMVPPEMLESDIKKAVF